jgi:hypothetical protein
MMVNDGSSGFIYVIARAMIPLAIAAHTAVMMFWLI